MLTNRLMLEVRAIRSLTVSQKELKSLSTQAFVYSSDNESILTKHRILTVHGTKLDFFTLVFGGNFFLNFSKLCSFAMYWLTVKSMLPRKKVWLGELTVLTKL